MKKKRLKQKFPLGELKKLFCIMKLVFFFLLLSSNLVWAGTTYAQLTSLNLELKNVTLEEVFDAIRKQSEFEFFYNNDQVNTSVKVSVKAKNADIYAVLEQALPNIYEYKINDRYILVNKRRETAPVLSPEPPQTKRTITGQVIDKDGEAIIGANIVEKGTTNGTVTDIDGRFSLNVDNEAVLQISYIGYISEEVLVGEKEEINLVMIENVRQIDEVVIVSYGTQKKREITGSITNIKASSLADLPVGQIGQKLQGQIAGVQINQTTGVPGQGMTFRIRGAASISNSSEPLIVVDGMPISTGLNNINPDEIESFSVLKDAAATSLYGSRAANGVILINTKRGKEGRLTVSLNTNVGIQSLNGLKNMEIMNGQEFAQFKKEYYEDRLLYEGIAIPDAAIEKYWNPEKYGKGTDWYDLLTRTGVMQTYNLSLTGGGDRMTTATTLGYFKQEGVIKNSKFERITLRSNNDYEVNDRIKIGLNMAPIVQIFQNSNTDGDRQILSGAMIADPTNSPWDENGNRVLSLSSPDMFSSVNWLNAIDDRLEETRVLTLLANAFAEIDIWDGLQYKFQFSTDLQGRRFRKWRPSHAQGGWSSAPTPTSDPSAEFNTENYYTWTLDNMLTYDKAFGDHTLGLLAGYSAQKYSQERQTLVGSQFPDNSIPWVSAGATRIGNVGLDQWSVASFLARVDYNYKNRYMLQANLRNDGSSRFGPNAKYAYFPSVSAGWIISDESFMEPLIKTMNYLKLRASYGVTGNYNIGNYSHTVSIASADDYVFDGKIAQGKVQNIIGNASLTWEETTQLNIGVDLGFLKDRIFFMYDYYDKTTDGMLSSINIQKSSGFSSITGNIGEFHAWGHEFTVESRNLVGELSWKTNLNVSFNRNKVIRLGLNDTPMGGLTDMFGVSALIVGQPIGVFTGLVFDGLYMNQEELDSQPKHATSDIGTVRYKDLGGPDGVPDGIIDVYDKTVIGDPNPKMQFGLTNEFKWKKFDLSFLMTGQVGGDIYAKCFENFLNLDGVFNVLKEVKDRWRSPENPGNGRIQRTLSGKTELSRSSNDLWVYDGTQLTLRNVTLGYTLPVKENKYIRHARFYITAQQLFVLSKYPGPNPEVNSTTNNELRWNGMGIDRSVYPVPRTFSVGCNLTF